MPGINQFIILLLVVLSAPVQSQYYSESSHAKACELMMDAGASRLLRNDTTQALLISAEAFDEAIKANDANLVTRVKLFELNIYQQKRNFTEGRTQNTRGSGIKKLPRIHILNFLNIDPVPLPGTNVFLLFSFPEKILNKA